MRRPFMIRSSLTLIGVAAGLSLAACTSTENSNSNIEGTLSAAGASFPAAIYQRWFSDLAPQGIRVNYQSVGSGAGVRQFTAGTVDFGASDKPMKPEAIDKVNRTRFRYLSTIQFIDQANKFLAIELPASIALF